MCKPLKYCSIVRPRPAARRGALRIPALAFATLLLAAPGALAATPGGDGAASAWARTDHSAVRLIAAQRAVDASGKARLGLQFRLNPGWKVYWRSPGDAGVAPAIDWTGSGNLGSAHLLWPLPERFTLFGLTTYVYGGEVVLPIDARAARAGAGLDLAAKVNYLVCEKICIPYGARLALTLPAGGGEAQPSVHAAAIARFAAAVPPRLSADPSAAPLAVTRAVLSRGPDGLLLLEILARSETPFSAPDALIEGPPGVYFGVPRAEIGADRKTALLRLPVNAVGTTSALPRRPTFTVTLSDGPRAVEQAVTVEVVEGAAGVGADILWVLALAFVGGLILNLMPCVLPVLSLKLLSVVGHGGEVRAVRRGFVATAAGIVFSFLVLAGGAIALKEAGAAAGWGIQFQQPVFLSAMTAVLVLFAANLFGLFAIPLPGFIADIGAEGSGGRLGGAFATGAFATLLATPCSAPFVGTAVGFALSRGPSEILVVFAALGLGLAAPYLAVAIHPRLAAWLPRPGPWMGWLRKALGVALLGTALWLVSVLWALVGPAPAIVSAVLLALALGLLGLVAAGRAHRLKGAPLAVGLLALAAVFAPMAPLGSEAGAPRPAAAAPAHWQPFDRVAIFNHVAEGRVVFVDVTADWCVTCKANKALVLDRSPVRDRLSADGVVAMQADWTRPDPKIARYLRGFGRFGIPFNVVYGPGAPAGIALPELLTADAVLDALERARGPRPARADAQ